MLTTTKNYCLFFNHPKKCYICTSRHRETLPICNGCFNDLPWLVNTCPRCALPLTPPYNKNSPCGQCLKKPPAYHQIRAAFAYNFPINIMIMKAKFNNKVHYLRLLSLLFAQQLSDSEQPDLIVPVPIHPQRLLRRQYNQASLIARHLSRQLHTPYSDALLSKVINTDQQSQLDARHRQRNIRGSFSCLSKPPTHIALVDDVVTTGATVNELSRVLKQAGCQRVDVWALARTGKED